MTSKSCSRRVRPFLPILVFLVLAMAGSALASDTPLPTDAAGLDLNNDGIADPVFLNRGQGAQVCMSSGVGGGYSCSILAGTPGGNNDNLDGAVGDFDQDGDNDLFLAGFSFSQYCENHPVGTLTCQPLSHANRGVTSLALGDMNNDGHLDAHQAGVVYWNTCFGDGQGGFDCVDNPLTYRSQEIALGDLDSDGFLDGVYGHGGSLVNPLCFNDQTGTMSCSPMPLSDPTSLGSGSTLADFDDDGHLDSFLVFGQSNRPRQYHFCQGSASGSFTCQNFEGLIGLPSQAASADLNDDGLIDVVIANQQSNNVRHPSARCLNLGGGNFSCAPFGPADSHIGVVIYHHDNDGHLDLMLATATYRGSGWNHLCLGRGDGSFNCSNFTASGTLNTDKMARPAWSSPGGGSSPSLVASWGFDEGSGTVAGDTSGNGLDGTLQGGAGWTDGQSGSALEFDGIDDYVEILDGPDSAFDITDALTVALWVKPESLGAEQSLVSKDKAYEFELGWAGISGRYGARLDNTAPGYGNTLVDSHAWQHLAMVWDGTTVTYYYNGVADGSSAYAGPLPTNDNPVGIGARPTEYGPQYPFEGRLDSVVIHDQALSATEIAALAATYTDITAPVRSNGAPIHALAGGSTSGILSLDTDENADCRYSETAATDWTSMTPFDTTGGTSHSTTVTGLSDGQIFDYFVRCQDTLGNTNKDDYAIVFAVDDVDLTAGLISAWRFDDGSGCSTADAFGSNPGTLQLDCPGDAPTWTTGREGGALEFDGGNHEVRVANSASLSTYSALSIGAWVKHGDVDSSWRAIVDQRDKVDDGISFYIDALGRLYLRVDGKTHVGTVLIDDGEWHHVVGTYDGSAIRLYVDTVLDTTKTVGAETVNVSAPLRIGHRFSSNSSTFDGTIDEVVLYDRALSNTDIWELFLDSP